MSGSIDEDTVRHVALLARIHLGDEEVRRFAGQLESILHYFDKLQQLDTSGVRPLVHAVETQDVLAPDVEGRSLSREDALANAPRHDGEYFEVPTILGGGS